MRSDVPVGTTLSSGVDSSTVVCLLRTFYEGEHETFTAKYSGKQADESAQAERLARSLNMDPNSIPAFAGEFLPQLRQVVRHLESPHYSPATILVWNIMASARKKVTVVLEGQGSDELLAGYSRRCAPYMIWDKLSSGRITQAYRELGLQLQTFGLWQVLLYTGQAFFPTTHYLLRYLRGDEKIYIGNLRNGPSFPQERHASPVMKDRLNSALRWQHETTLVDLLHYGDALSMAHSVESRLPFMDHRLVELCFRLPGHLKFVEGRGKAILKRAVRSDVPRERSIKPSRESTLSEARCDLSSIEREQKDLPLPCT